MLLMGVCVILPASADFSLPDSFFHPHLEPAGWWWTQIWNYNSHTKITTIQLKKQSKWRIEGFDHITNFCMMGSRSSKAGSTSFSGLLVSTAVLTVAMYIPSEAKLWL